MLRCLPSHAVRRWVEAPSLPCY